MPVFILCLLFKRTAPLFIKDWHERVKASFKKRGLHTEVRLVLKKCVQYFRRPLFSKKGRLNVQTTLFIPVTLQNGCRIGTDDFDKRCAFAQEPQCVLDFFVVLMPFDVDEEQVFPQRGFARAAFELGH